jgi:hypothetical protein
MKRILNKTTLAVLAAVATTFSLHADPYAKGSTVKAFDAKDQHEQAYHFDAKSTRFLMVSHDMDTGKKANGVLTTLGKDYLPGKKAVYMANIHGMPGIGRAFALPKMKKYAHRIILADDEKLIADFPEQKGKVTVLKLADGKVSSLQYWDPATGSPDALLK